MQQARHTQAVEGYRQAVLVACEEVENAMTNLNHELQRSRQLDGAAQLARRAAQTSQADYQRGLANFQRVLDAQQSFHEVYDELATSRSNVSLYYVSLFKALGGGW